MNVAKKQKNWDPCVQAISQIYETYSVSGAVIVKGNCLLSIKNCTKHFMLSQFIKKLIIWDQKVKETKRSISTTMSTTQIEFDNCNKREFKALLGYKQKKSKIFKIN